MLSYFFFQIKDKPFVVFDISNIQNIHPLNDLVHGS